MSSYRPSGFDNHLLELFGGYILKTHAKSLHGFADIFSGLIRLIVFYENEGPSLGCQRFSGLFKPFNQCANRGIGFGNFQDPLVESYKLSYIL